MENIYDVIIAGAGVAGLYTALSLNPDLSVLILSKKNLSVCNTSLAQGGIAGVMDFKDDSYENHINDTLIAGGYRNDLTAVDVLVRSGTQRLESLINYGVDFDKDTGGGLNMTLEGGHSKRRILHNKDTTGSEIHNKLASAVKKHKNITVMENTALDCVKKESGYFQTCVITKAGREYYYGKKLVIATGGIGMAYKYTTNSVISTGDGIAAAIKLGAEIKNISYIQFHPTAFAGGKSEKCGERLLISEAVRGEGAYLLNYKYERFMQKYDGRLELAPRDIVSRSIMTEVRRSGSENIYLDISYKNAETVRRRFPMIYGRLLSEGYDMTKEPIPVFPCQHYLMGGINTDIDGKTSVEGLYAVGECAHTGVHGKNRLASNSLLEAVVFGKRAAAHIEEVLLDGVKIDICNEDIERENYSEDVPDDYVKNIRDIMQKSYFVFPDKSDIIEGFERIRRLKRELENGKYRTGIKLLEANSLVSVAEMILAEALGN